MTVEFIPRIRGYLPCRVVSKKPNSRGQVMVEFEDGARLWIAAERVKGAPQ